MKLFLNSFLVLIVLVLFFSGEIKGLQAAESSRASQVVALETPLERLHRPLVRTPETVGKNELFFVSIQVGDKIHELTPEHHIDWIEATLNGKRVFRATLTPFLPEARMTFPLRLKNTSTLKVEAHCNRHGTWGREIQIRTKSSLF